MFIKSTDRRELVEILQAGSLGEVNWSEERLPLGKQELRLVWRDQNKNRSTFPVAVVIPRRLQRDFFAWTTTYLPSYKPFTAYCRVVDEELAPVILDSSEDVSLGKLESACAGLILAEARTYLGTKGPQLTPLGCASTLSFALARSTALGGMASLLELIAHSWALTRSLTSQPKLPLDVSSLLSPWAALFSAANDRPEARPHGDHEIYTACADLYSSGEISKDTASRISRDFPAFSSYHSALAGSRESRVVSLEHTFGSLMSSRIARSEYGAFLAGYLTSQVAPGSFDHAELLTSMLPIYPNALLWYGLCAGLQKKSGVLQHAQNIGRRVVRDVTRREDILDRPSTDIALPELEVLMSGEAREGFRTGIQGQLNVEIFPRIATTVRWPARTDAANESGASQAELAALSSEFARKIEELGVIRNKLASIANPAKHTQAPAPIPASKKYKERRRRDYYEPR